MSVLAGLGPLVQVVGGRGYQPRRRAEPLAKRQPRPRGHLAGLKLRAVGVLDRRAEQPPKGVDPLGGAFPTLAPFAVLGGLGKIAQPVLRAGLGKHTLAGRGQRPVVAPHPVQALHGCRSEHAAVRAGRAAFGSNAPGGGSRGARRGERPRPSPVPGGPRARSPPGPACRGPAHTVQVPGPLCHCCLRLEGTEAMGCAPVGANASTVSRASNVFASVPGPGAFHRRRGRLFAFLAGERRRTGSPAQGLEPTSLRPHVAPGRFLAVFEVPQKRGNPLDKRVSVL